MRHFEMDWTTKKSVMFRARRHGDFLRVYFDQPLFDCEW